MRHVINDILIESEKCTNCIHISRFRDEFYCGKNGQGVLKEMSAIYCEWYDPCQQIRVARREDGSLYASRTDGRNDYADETISYHDRAADAVIEVMKMNE